MISGSDFYHVLTAMVPLYVAMILAYASVKWWKIFTPDQCSGINRFVALFAVPLLSFHFIATNDPYAMNFRFILADTLQKLMVLGILFLYAKISKNGSSFDWIITFFSLSTLPNTLVMGIPLLKGMYGDFCGGLMVQIVVLQCIVWYTLMLFMFEYRAAIILISHQFPETADSIISIHVESDVVSLQHDQPLETVVGDIREDGKFHVTLRLSNAEIYSVQTSRNPTPRTSDAQLRRSDVGDDTEHEPVYQWSSPVSPVSDKVFDPPSITDRFFGSPSRTISLSVEDMEMRFEKSPTSSVGLEEKENKKKGKVMPPRKVMTRLILIMVWRKLIRNPNTYSSFIGLFWSLISFRWHVEMPPIIANSISILSDTGLGMAMFSLGLFMALQPRMIVCDKSMVAFAMAVRFIIGPAFMAVASLILGIGGILLSVAIVQAALPQGIVPFVFAKEYNLHADILSTAVIFGMLVALPVAVLYYLILGL